MDASINNPAGRLHDFLAHCWSNNVAQTRISDVWSEYCQAEDGTVAYAHSIADLLSLPAQIRRALEGAPRSSITPTSFLIAQLPRLDEALSWGFIHQREWISGFLKQYDQGDIARVELMSQMLGGLAPSGVTSGTLTELTDLSEQITNLVTEDDSLESDLRELLLDLANGIQSVVHAYAVRGPEALARERDLLIGRLMSNPALAAKLVDNQRARRLVQRTVIVATAALTFFNLGAQAMDNAPKVIDHVQHVTQLLIPAETSDVKQIDAPPTPAP